jgi:hypothetical protein
MLHNIGLMNQCTMHNSDCIACTRDDEPQTLILSNPKMHSDSNTNSKKILIISRGFFEKKISSSYTRLAVALMMIQRNPADPRWSHFAPWVNQLASASYALEHPIAQSRSASSELQQDLAPSPL